MPISQILLTAGSGGSPAPAINIYGWVSSMNEGSTNTVTVGYEDYPPTTIYWQIVNDGTANADWLNGTIPSGSIEISGTNTDTFSWTTAEDLTTEGNQNYLLQVGTTLGGNNLLNETLTITDTSIAVQQDEPAQTRLTPRAGRTDTTSAWTGLQTQIRRRLAEYRLYWSAFSMV